MSGNTKMLSPGQQPAKELSHQQKQYGFLFCLSRSLLRLFSEKYAMQGERPLDPVIYIGHHQNTKGAIRLMAWLDNPVRLWMLSVFFDKKSCFDHYSHYTLTERKGLNKANARALAAIYTAYVPRLAKSMRAIPVYRNSIRAMNVTIKDSVEALCSGESILLFPDIDYTSESGSIGELYTGFINIDKHYYAQKGEHIRFVPLVANLATKKIIYGNASVIRDGESFIEEKKRVIAELQNEMNKEETSEAVF
ncbi:MAG: hypothetical protein FWG30_09260 [Eubacteriaceae bacterium]|nr:hypothetical protein [Eubacteriaceae bacterium]